MAYIRVDVAHTIKNGSRVAFKAPCNCNAVNGLKVYFPNDKGIATNQTFVFSDAHGNDLTGVGNLFMAGVLVKAILNLDDGKAYLQNADTNKYLEGALAGKAPVGHTHTPAAIGAAEASHGHAWSAITDKPNTFTPESHTQAASTITAGTFPETAVKAANGTDYSVYRIRNIAAATAATQSAVPNGSLYLAYE